MWRYIEEWNIVECDAKQGMSLNYMLLQLLHNKTNHTTLNGHFKIFIYVWCGKRIAAQLIRQHIR